MIRRLCAYGRLCLVSAWVATSAAGQALTERQALQLLRESPYFVELQARVEVTRAERRRDTVYPNPSAVGWAEGAGQTNFFTVEQPLALNGRLRLLRQAGESAVAATQAQGDYELRQIEALVRLAFGELVYAQERKSAITASMAELEDLVRILREREDAGEGSKFDRLRAEREIIERRSELDGVETSIAQARARLAGFLGQRIAPEGLVAKGTLDRTASPPEVMGAMQSALMTRGDYRSQEAALQTLETEAQAADRRRIPNPVVLAGLKRAQVGSANRYANGPVVSVSVDLPLFNKGQAERRLAEAEAARVRARRSILETQILADVRGAHQTLLLRLAAADRYERSSQQRAEELRAIAEIAYREGELGILELIDSFRVAQQAQLRLLELKAAARMAQIELDRAMGAEVTP
ncbi:MAG: hypothetical protein GC160_20950 [Acidobacteria bacterium]|nr:hypothetical protein [Acidobacteriota bacterium]